MSLRVTGQNLRRNHHPYTDEWSNHDALRIHHLDSSLVLLRCDAAGFRNGGTARAQIYFAARNDYLSRTLQTSRLSMYDMMVGRHRLCIHKGFKSATSQGRKRHHGTNIVTIFTLNSKEPTSEEVNKHKEAGLFVQPWLVVFLIFVWAGHCIGVITNDGPSTRWFAVVNRMIYPASLPIPIQIPYLQEHPGVHVRPSTPPPASPPGPPLISNPNKELNNNSMPFKLLFARLAMKHRKQRQEQSKTQAAVEAKPLGIQKTAGRESGESTAAQASEGSHTEGTRRQRRRDRKANRG
ncbi:hypothetical protein FPV67DRAFT_1658273 [Lyophyllum atratum]|nr:hypothetical protein FPV67DRAFT_1658273 [Lyophyllum atratum]